MSHHRSRAALAASALVCWGCFHVAPLPPVFHAASPRTPPPESAPAARDPEPAPELPGDWDVPLRREWTHIVLHHSATAVGGAERFDRFHRRDRGWENGLGYHFVIGNGTDTPDGAIEVGPRWRRQLQGAHAGNTRYNDQGIGICLVGDFRTHAPSRRQVAALRVLTAALRARCGIPAAQVVGHRDVRDGTECPGDRFPVSLAFADPDRD